MANFEVLHGHLMRHSGAGSAVRLKARKTTQPAHMPQDCVSAQPARALHVERDGGSDSTYVRSDHALGKSISQAQSLNDRKRRGAAYIDVIPASLHVKHLSTHHAFALEVLKKCVLSLELRIADVAALAGLSRFESAT